MSAEGKKKRGQAGLTKALNSPFRLNGRAPDWAARSVGAFSVQSAPSSGSTTMRGILGGVLVEKIFVFELRGKYDRMLVHAQKRCGHPLFSDDGEQMSEAAE